METPPPEPPLRRTTRSALVEIPARMGALSVSENRLNARLHPVNTNNIMTNLNVDINQIILPNSYISPAPSPDELVIQARGRRRMPPWSPPDVSTPPGIRRTGDSPNRKERTPIKPGVQFSPNGKSTIVLRSTPRKRLLMSDPLDHVASPSVKKMKIELPPVQGPVEITLKALSQEQLINVISGIISRHPDLEEEIKSKLPAPDLKPLSDKLHELRKNIYKCLPNSRLTSKTDSPAYNRASTHVLTFKKAILEAGKVLTASQQWEAVIAFVILGWEQTALTPLWENPPHNVARKQCFKFLAAQCMTALKKLIHIPKEEAERIHLKLIGFIKDSEEIIPCVAQLESMIGKA
ncbi:tethering factor for nuclear proteasome sts1 isoform X2 [Cimex lectularius]|uniref:Uncharacterized protein n=1 Tax=Cimex lectularius TaxID=79782 RepID=A0A8I6S9P7_CIMLE|nr:tethering factor for nuclear proteasome sts1 isoform X2 [Cimex lectularius]